MCSHARILKIGPKYCLALALILQSPPLTYHLCSMRCCSCCSSCSPALVALRTTLHRQRMYSTSCRRKTEKSNVNIGAVLIVKTPRGPRRCCSSIILSHIAMRFPLLLLQAVLLFDALGVLAFQSTCVKEFAASSLAVMTAGVMSTFTITATDYPGNPCTIGSEMFGFNLMPFPGNVSLSGRFNSQWSVTPPNQFVLPLLLTSSGAYSAEIVRFGASSPRLFIASRCAFHLSTSSRERAWRHILRKSTLQRTCSYVKSGPRRRLRLARRRHHARRSRLCHHSLVRQDPLVVVSRAHVLRSRRRRRPPVDRQRSRYRPMGRAPQHVCAECWLLCSMLRAAHSLYAGLLPPK
jgi:hypothetical protein